MKMEKETIKNEGRKNAVIYARFSSHSQTEQSIEGQLKECYAYAALHGFKVIEKYIDRAKTGKSDDRYAFQKMISDSYDRNFDVVLVYQYDRFTRNRYDSAMYDRTLSDNGVRLISVKEDIGDGANAALMRGIFESLNEYYSLELSQKVRRGMELNAEKCLSNGSNPGLGYKVNPDKTFRVDEAEARAVREIFDRFNAGETVTQIIRSLNERGIKTSLGRDFKQTSLHSLLRNKRYVGLYTYGDIEIPGGMPRIVSDDLFYAVQSKIEERKKSRARHRNGTDYILTSKLFCGNCNSLMTGYSGNGKGKKYKYYACTESKTKNAKKE